ncbi:phage neck terminator protein [Achromobacter pestifer]
MTPEDAIFSLVEAAAGGVPLLFSDTPDPRPPLPYITLALRWVDVGPAEEGRVDDQGNQAVHDHRDATVALQGFGEGAYRALGKLGLVLRHPAFEDRAEALGLALYHVGRLESVPAAVDGTGAPAHRALEVGIRYAQTYTDFVGVIETVTGTITTTGGLMPSLETSFTAKTVTAP